MPCIFCSSVSIPESIRQICPECFIEISDNYKNDYVIGISDSELGIGYVLKHFSLQISQLSDIYIYSYYFTDMGDLVAINTKTGLPIVSYNNAWTSWDYYCKIIKGVIK